MVAVMNGCSVQKIGTAPASLNWCEKVAFRPKFPLLKVPSPRGGTPDVTVCAVGSLFTQVTVVPLGIAIVASLNWKISDVISVGGGSGVLVGVGGTGVSVGALVGVEVDSDAAVANADGDSAGSDVAVLVGATGAGVSEG